MKKWIALLCASAMVFSLTACDSSTDSSDDGTAVESVEDADTDSASALISDREYIEETLNLANNTDYT